MSALWRALPPLTTYLAVVSSALSDSACIFVTHSKFSLDAGTSTCSVLYSYGPYGAIFSKFVVLTVSTFILSVVVKVQKALFA